MCSNAAGDFGVGGKSKGAMENLRVLTHDYFNCREGIYPLALGTEGQVLKTRVLLC